jgi:hypothetical protein
MQASDVILYTGTCDNLDCAGETFGDCNPGDTPIRVYEDGDGRLWLQAQGITVIDADNDEYEWSDWSNDAVPHSMRGWFPEPDAALVARLIEARLLDS